MLNKPYLKYHSLSGPSKQKTEEEWDIAEAQYIVDRYAGKILKANPLFGKEDFQLPIIPWLPDEVSVIETIA